MEATDEEAIIQNQVRQSAFVDYFMLPDLLLIIGKLIHFWQTYKLFWQIEIFYKKFFKIKLIPLNVCRPSFLFFMIKLKFYKFSSAIKRVAIYRIKQAVQIMNHQSSEGNYSESIHKYPDCLQKIKLVAQRAFWSNVDKYLNSYYNPQKIKIEDELFLCQKQQTLKRLYRHYEYSNKMKMLISYYQYHTEIPRIFIDRVSGIMEENYDAKRDLQYVRVTNQLKKQRDFAQARQQYQHGSFGRGINDPQKNQKPKQFSSFNLLDDLTLSQKSVVLNIQSSQIDNFEDMSATLMKKKLALSNIGSLQLPYNQLLYQPKKTPRQKSKGFLIEFQNKKNTQDKNSTDSELKVVSKQILVPKKIVKGVFISNGQFCNSDNHVRMSFIRKMIEKIDQKQTIMATAQRSNQNKKQQVNNSKSINKSNYKTQIQIFQDKMIKNDNNSKHKEISSTNNKKMFNNLIEMKKRVK